jgi:hypothetical protein
MCQLLPKSLPQNVQISLKPVHFCHVNEAPKNRWEENEYKLSSFTCVLSNAYSPWDTKWKQSTQLSFSPKLVWLTSEFIPCVLFCHISCKIKTAQIQLNQLFVPTIIGWLHNFFSFLPSYHLFSMRHQMHISNTKRLNCHFFAKTQPQMNKYHVYSGS